jgi:hypothetical protein
MKNMVIKRYLDPKNLTKIKNDFSFLVKNFELDNYMGEFYIALRENYFNIYFQGNSLARVDFLKNGYYNFKIHERFYKGTKASEMVEEKKLKLSEGKSYKVITLDQKNLKSFLTMKHIKGFASKIRKVNHSEELRLEQVVITDNLGREDIIIIDRQVADKDVKKRVDLLALKKVEGSEKKFSFLVIEVKLGNNPELKGKVAEQLSAYVKHIEDKFEDYKTCYLKHFKQKKEIGLIKKPEYEDIEIIKPVKGMVLVLGYSGIAKSRIKTLRKEYPDLKVKPIYYWLDLSELS